MLVANIAQKWLRAAGELLEERDGDARTGAVKPEAAATFTVEGLFLAFLNMFAAQVAGGRLGLLRRHSSELSKTSCV